MKEDERFLPPRMPHLLLSVVLSAESGELRFKDGEDSFRVTLRGRVWRLFEMLLLAQLEATDEQPHRGFRTAKDLQAELSGRPLLDEVVRRVDRLRHKLAKAKFGTGRASEASVKTFRQAIIETTGVGYRLSIPAENISVWHTRQDDQHSDDSP